MPSPISSSTALPIAYFALRTLIVLNWVYGLGILVLLFVMPHERWIMASFKLEPSPDAERLIMGLRVIAVIGLSAVPLHYVVFKRLLAIVESVRAGNAFADTNALRLKTIAWMLLILNVLSIVIGGIARGISSPEHPLHLNAGFSVNGWLAVLLTFVLARVFAEGSNMRADLEGTV